MIVITVPHSEPIREPIREQVREPIREHFINNFSIPKYLQERNYDLAAEPFANILSSILKEQIPHKQIVQINSEQNRHTTLDDNRFRHQITKKTITTSPLWEKLRQTIFEYAKTSDYKNIIILDVHSFPNMTKDFDENDVVILDNDPNQNIVIALIKFLNQKPISHKLLTARTGSNSILDVHTLNPLYIPTILIEINEKHLNNINKLTEIATAITDFLKDYKNGTKRYKFNV